MITWKYLAGFFDGEGHISIYDYVRKRGYRSRAVKGIKNRPCKREIIYFERSVRLCMAQNVRFTLGITQKKTKVLYEIKKFLLAKHLHSTNITRPKSSRTNFPCSILYVQKRKDVLVMLRKLLPYLIVKKAKAKIAVKFLEKLMKKGEL